jgi:hypothetical protein
MSKRAGGYAGVLLLCGGYFVCYIFFGVFLKYLLSTAEGFPGMPGMEILFNTSVGGMGVALAVVLVFWWPGRLQSTMPRILGGRLPGEYAWLIPSGICTGFVIPTTTLMYTYGYSVMVAMVLMRSALIVASRFVDALLIRQGHLDKEVYWQENAAVVAALGALSIVVFGAGSEDFQFFKSPTAMITMGFYIIPYSIRIYILSRFKLKADHKALFGIEQLFAAITVALVVGTCLTFYYFGWKPPQMQEFVQGVTNPSPLAILIGVPFGIGAFFSVFLYLYKGGTATFNITVNRCTSLVAGTVATLIFHFAFGGKAVKSQDWIALSVVFMAIAFLTWAGKRRLQEQ